MSARKRIQSGMKRQYKNKLSIMYESIFKGEDLTQNYPNFWSEFLLLKPCVSNIENDITRLNDETLNQCRKNINLLVHKCIDALGDDNPYRILYSLQTLSAVFLSLYKKYNNNEKTFDFVDVAFGSENVKEKMSTLINYSNTFLSGEYESHLKASFIKLLMIFATGLDEINKNELLDFIANSTVFDTLIQLLRHTASRVQHGYEIVVVITLLVNYKKYESANPFTVKLSIVDDELALNGYGQVISSSLLSFCRRFSQLNSELEASWFSSFTSMIGNMFVGDEEAKYQQIRENDALVLALYEATHLNRNFVTTLAYTQTDASSPPSPKITSASNQSPTNTQIDITTQPFNLLAIFFQYCSIVMLAAITEAIDYNVKLCFLVLHCISEDQYANSLMHDTNLAFRIQLHKMPMHHRKRNQTIAVSQPLAATLLDLIVEFITSHMMKKFPIELYHQCTGILLRILCYQKRCRVRLNYQWKNLWTALMNLLKFLTTHETHFVKKLDIFSLSTEVVNIMNIFVTYGDMFLLSPNTYDELFYEIIRMKSIFVNLNSMALRYSNCETYAHKDSAIRLTNALVNMRDILNHFPPKISEWLAKENISTPSEEQIMNIIIENYDTLTLKLQDNLDQYKRYTENPENIQFFNKLVKTIITTARGFIDSNSMGSETVLQELQQPN